MLSCERALMSEVDVKNCIRFYTTADEIGAKELKNHCSQLISTHWVILNFVYFTPYTSWGRVPINHWLEKVVMTSENFVPCRDNLLLYLIKKNRLLMSLVLYGHNCVNVTTDQLLSEFLLFQSDFSSEDFEHMSAPLLYTMFKTKTKYPLHSAVRLKREDVVFLFLIEYSQEVMIF